MPTPILAPGNPQPWSLPFNSLPCLSHEPRETRKFVTFNIAWLTDVGAAKHFMANMDAEQAQISQISALWVDNSACAHAVNILFPDSQQQIIVPLSANGAMWPVITGGTRFEAWCSAAAGADTTILIALNYVPYINAGR